jgi:hypothetical protein
MKARYKTIVDSYAQAIHRGQLAAAACRRIVRLPPRSGSRWPRPRAFIVNWKQWGWSAVKPGAAPLYGISRAPGHGVDQQALAGDVDLNFNYPSLPAQGCAARGAQATGDGGGY